MKRNILRLFLILIIVLFILQPSVFAKNNTVDKARTVITTDGEVDDMNSMIRFMLYANEVDLEGIVLTSSTYHFSGDEKKGIEPYRWTGTEWIYDFIDKYEKIYSNLKIHADGYPDPDFLRRNTKIGNITNVGEMGKKTDGSRFLKKLFLDNDSRKLYVQTWGGTNTTARALKSIEAEYKNTEQWEVIKDKINQKLVIYIILDQDDSYANYIAKKWPEIQIINDRSNFWHFAYAWKFHSPEVNKFLQGDWLYKNIKKNHGPLMEEYALMGDGNYLEGELFSEQRGTDEYLEKNPQYNRYDFISEGDSPSFLYLVKNGLRSLEDPTYGGWGGRFAVIDENLWKNDVLDYNPYSKRYEAEYTLMRWFDDLQRDFAARADWSVADSYGEANHHPEITVKEGIDLEAKPGETITLHAVAEDPDDDILSFNWWHYAEADSYQESKIEKNKKIYNSNSGLLLSITREVKKDEIIDNLELQNKKTATVSFNVPENAEPGDTIHIIGEVTDDGEIKLKDYQRVIITVR
ncbi:MAG: nucleoside hydrolase-like domain-containing protein [Halanaerobiales bacterium]|nr:nucleoside hydrolase-like domain-containing protein [Halanaerobiales bacterium]